MHNLYIVSIVIGILMFFTGNFWIVFRAFKISLGWAFICMSIGWVGPLLFAVEHWKLAKVPLFLLYIGTALLLFGHFSLNSV